MFLIRLFLLGLLFLGIGCASYFKRKECEQTNWFQHGHNVAMAGKRLDADEHILQCQKAEAKISYQAADQGFKEGMSRYCDLDTVFQTGKSGRRFNFGMCDGLQENAMRQKFNQGVREYCQKDNGYPVGASGAVYEKLCPGDLEKAFLKEYGRGRKVYLSEIIRQKEQEIQESDLDLGRIERERKSKNDEITRLEFRRIIELRQASDQQAKERTENKFKDEREALEREIQRLNSEIHKVQARKKSLREDLRKLHSEAVAL